MIDLGFLNYRCIFNIIRSFDGDGLPKRLDIRNLIVEFNIYEKLNGNFLSGDMTLTRWYQKCHTRTTHHRF